MMKEGLGGSGDVLRNRCVLGDVTNNYKKRGFPLVSGKFVIGNKINRHQESPETVVEDAHFEKRVRGGEQFVEKGKERIGCVQKICENVEDGKGKGLSFPNAKRLSKPLASNYGGDSTQANAGLDDLLHAEETKESSGSLNFNLQMMSSDSTVHLIPEIDSSRHSCTSFDSVPEECHKGRDLSPVLEKQVQADNGTGSADFMRYAIETEREDYKSSDSNDINLDFMVVKEDRVDDGECLTQELLHKYCSEGSSRPSRPWDFKMFGTCNGERSINVEDDIGSHKSCSCSLCLKAAYIWTDLHYQDNKGRLAALKKSRRHARSLEGRIYSHDHTDKVAIVNPKKSTKVEFDLMQHLRTVFLHTEDILVRESTHLHSSVLKLKELRENCKRDLEMFGMVSSNKSQSCDASDDSNKHV